MDPKLKDKLREIFNKYDPMEIYESKEINFDEYDPEIKEILVRFHKSKNLEEFTDEFHNVFQIMFGQNTAGPKTGYEELSKNVYKLLKNELGGIK